MWRHRKPGAGGVVERGVDALRGGSDGALVPFGSAAPARPLLSSEVDLCEAIGLTAEEYLHFDALRAAWKPERPPGYEAVPEVQAGPVLGFVINLVVGVALSAVSALIAPKPRGGSQAKAPPQLKTADINQTTRFASTQGFSSVQELARLGETVPLIFCHRDHIPGLGGVRADGKLVWSQLLSTGSGQQLRIMATFGLARIPTDHRPSYAGYAIGDSTLKNYTRAKIALYFRENGGRISEFGPERYLEGTLQRHPGPDPFAVFDDRSNTDQPWLSGTRTPSTQTQFGCYQPMPNGSVYKVNYELIVVPRPRKDEEDDWDWDVTDDADTKQDKVYRGRFSHYAAIKRAAGESGNGNRVTVRPGDIVEYQIQGDTEKGSLYKPWGVEDVNASTIDRRISADDSIKVGDIYMAGEALVVCEKVDDGPWERGRTKTYFFRCLEEGEVRTYSPSEKHDKPESYCLQRVAIATVANNRECDITEIGIKSTVWRQINGFSNVNSHPGGDVVYNYGREKGSITLGSLNRYNKRLSFFKLQFRPLGRSSDADGWIDITPDVFFVKGNAPVPQYNYLRISHPRGQYEFRMKPVSGGWIYHKMLGARAYMLRSGSRRRTVVRNGLLVTFEAEQVTLNGEMVSNTDWLIGREADLDNDNLRENDGICDYKVYDAERTSAEEEPEHEIVYVNEIVANQTPPQYPGLLMCGLRMSSTVEFSQFEQLSAWFTHGTMVERLIGRDQFNPLGPGVYWSTNNLGEIVYGLLTNTEWGAGKLIGPLAVNRERCTVAAQFVQANRFTWDGVMEERVNLREWIFQQAGYCLLDFTIIGGRFSLYPAVPFKADFTIDHEWRVQERALFTDGTIRNLKVTWLPPEERQLFRAQCLWRQEFPDGFAQIRSLSVRLSDAQGGRDNDPEELFDMSGFATSREHPLTFMRYALRLRQLVDHTAEFETTPHAALGLSPGEAIRLISSVVHTSRLNNGSIDSSGAITSTYDFADGTYPILFWPPGTVGVQEAEMEVAGGRTTQGTLHDTVFALRQESAVSRFYKIERMARTREGFVRMTLSYLPVDSQGRLATLQWPEQDFVVEAS
jgi:hypothetical protein